MGTPSKAKSTRQTKVMRGDVATPTGFVTIAEIKTYDGPNSTAPDIDVSNFDSVEAEFIAALGVPGELSVTMNFIGSDPGQQGLEADRVAGTKRYWKLDFNDDAVTPTTVIFQAIVTAFAPSGNTNAAHEAKATLKLSGAKTWTYRP